MKPKGSPNAIEWDRSGKIIRRWWYADLARKPELPPKHADCPMRCTDQPQIITRGIHAGTQGKLI